MEDDDILSLLIASCQLVSRLDPDEVIERIISEAHSVVKAESCSVIVKDADTDELFFHATTDQQAGKLRRVRFDAGLGVAGEVLRTGEPQIVADTSEDERHYGGVDAEMGLATRSLVCVPLKADGEIIGVLEAVNAKSPDGFTARDVRLLAVLANFAGAAIQIAGQFQRVQLDACGFRSAAERGELFVGKSRAMKRVWQTAAKAAATHCTVLITGESGVGKEVVAYYIHQASQRADGPFICVNCAGLDENLLNSELFGHEKGAFTGADSRRIGRFEMADRGTLFFDEIVECTPGTQARLLRVLQEQKFERLGGTEPVRTAARILAATNVAVEDRVAAGQFREDLFHRLNVVQIKVPPLRERREEIAGLLRHCGECLAADMNRRPIEFTPEAIQVLQQYPWPGNVRELKNLVERIMVLHSRDTVDAGDLAGFLPAGGDSPRQAPAAEKTFWGQQKELIVEALKANSWNQSAAARALGISRHRLRYRIEKHGIRTNPE